jgi:hypothetical protein
MGYNNCVVIGAGSIGMNHCRIAIDMFEQVHVVDPLERARASISSRFPNAKIKETLAEALDDLVVSDTLSIIANWGPDHFNSFSELTDRGIRAVLCEKPFAHSALAIRQMVKTAQINDIDLRINHHRRYIGLAEIIRDKFADLNDECHMIVVHGGAQCVVTNGMHWLDLAGDVFLEDPISVFADLTDSKINPRSGTLGFWEGCAGWSFTKGKKFVISMTNRSRVSSKIVFYSRNARLDFIPGDGIYFGKMEPSDDLPVTRTARVEPIRISKDSSTFDATREILRQMKSNENRCAHLEKHATLTEAMIGALISSKKESKIYLPLVSTNPDFDTAWDIS